MYKIVNTGKKQPRIDPKTVAEGLGAEIVSLKELSPRSRAIVSSSPLSLAESHPLLWKIEKYGQEAFLGDFEKGDGVRFTLEHYPTCYRRGPWKLTIEVAHGPGHIKWGCFDDQDQPIRWYHDADCAKAEAEAIAQALQKDRKENP